MQISRHWRLNSLRYRLEGVRYQNGDVSLQNRPVVTEVRIHTAANKEGKADFISSTEAGIPTTVKTTGVRD